MCLASTSTANALLNSQEPNTVYTESRGLGFRLGIPITNHLSEPYQLCEAFTILVDAD